MRFSLRRAPPHGKLGARKPLRRLRVAAVLDEFSRACLAPDVTLLPLDARLWRAQLAWFRPDLLFVESAWRGWRDTWKFKVASYEDRDDDTLARLVAHCRAKEIPTVFWNKEDPVHFDRFVGSAALFDFVFTTDEGVVPDYEDQCDKASGTVRPLLFAAQPELHHPVGAQPEDTVCFAGSYGEAEFPQRRLDLEMLLDASTDFRLEILDRTARTKLADKAFPERFQPYVTGSLDYLALADKYRSCKVFLNVNSVRDSRTMFSRRVFEILACGGSVVSSPSRGIAELFGDTVAVVAAREEAEKAVRRFLEDADYRLETSARGVRGVLGSHTYEDRLREVCSAVGISTPEEERPGFSVLAFVHSETEALGLVDLLHCQEVPPRAVTVLIGGVEENRAPALSDGLRAAIGARAEVDIIDATDADSERAAARQAAAHIDADYVACVALDQHYGSEHLASLVTCLRFLDADLIGKVPPSPQPGTDARRRTSHTFVDWVHPHSVLIRRAALAEHGWSSRRRDLPELEDAYLGLRKYATDDFGFRTEEG